MAEVNQTQILDDLTSLQQSSQELDSARIDVETDPKNSGQADDPSLERKNPKENGYDGLPEGGRPDDFEVSTRSAQPNGERDFDIRIQNADNGPNRTEDPNKIDDIEPARFTGRSSTTGRGSSSGDAQQSTDQQQIVQETTEKTPTQSQETVTRIIVDQNGNVISPESLTKPTDPPTFTENSGFPEEISSVTVSEIVTQTIVSDPVVTTTFTDSEFCRADTENNKEIETTIRTYTDVSKVTTTIITTTTQITIITYEDGSTKQVVGDSVTNTEIREDITTSTREEVISTDTEDPIVTVEWIEETNSVTGDPRNSTEFVSENTVRTEDNENRRWIDTTTETFRDRTETDTTTTLTRTPKYTITYCDGTVETEIGTPVVTTSVVTNVTETPREIVTVNYEEYPITEVSRVTVNEVTTETVINDPVVTSTYTDSEFCRADTENNKTIETTIRTWTDTTTITTTVTTVTTPVTTITYTDGTTEIIRGETTTTQESTNDVTISTREETISTDLEDPIIEVVWNETTDSVTGDPSTTTEFVSENTVRTEDDENDRWVDTTTTTYRDTTTTDTTTTTTRTPTYTITYCDGTVETEIGTPVVTTSVTTNTVITTRDIVEIEYVDYPPPPAGEFRYGISYVAFEYIDADGVTQYMKFNFGVDSTEVNDVLDLAAYVGSKYGDVTDIFVHTGGANEITGAKGKNFYDVADDGTIVAVADTEQFPSGTSGQVTGVQTFDYPPDDLYTYEPELPDEPEDPPVDPPVEPPVDPEEPEDPVDPPVEPPVDPEEPEDPEPPVEPPVDPDPEIYTLNLNELNLIGDWQNNTDKYWRLFGNDQQGWTIQIDKDGPPAGRFEGKAYSWMDVVDGVNPDSVTYENGVINYTLDDTPPPEEIPPQI